MDYSLPDSSVHGISQARILEWVAMPSSRGSSHPSDPTHVSCIDRQILLPLSNQGSFQRKKNRNSFIIVRLSLIRELFKHICVFTSLSPMRIQYHLTVTAFTSPVFFYAFSYTIPSVWNVHLLPCSLAAVCLTLAMSFALF